MARATVTKTVRLPDDLARELEAAAKILGTSENSFITLAVAAYIKKSGLRAQITWDREGSRG